MAERHIWEMSPVATPKAFNVCGVLKSVTSRKSMSSKYSDGSRPQRTSSIYPMLFCTALRYSTSRFSSSSSSRKLPSVRVFNSAR